MSYILEDIGAALRGMFRDDHFRNHIEERGVDPAYLMRYYRADFKKVEEFYEHNYENLNRVKLQNALIDLDSESAEFILKEMTIEEHIPESSIDKYNNVLKDLVDISVPKEEFRDSMIQFFNTGFFGGLFKKKFESEEIESLVRDRMTSRLFTSDLSENEIANILNEIDHSDENIEYFKEAFGINIETTFDKEYVAHAYHNFNDRLLENNQIAEYIDVAEKEKIIDNLPNILENIKDEETRLEVLKAFSYRKDISFNQLPDEFFNFKDINLIISNLDGFNESIVKYIIYNEDFVESINNFSGDINEGDIINLYNKYGYSESGNIVFPDRLDFGIGSSDSSDFIRLSDTNITINTTTENVKVGPSKSAETSASSQTTNNASSETSTPDPSEASKSGSSDVVKDVQNAINPDLKLEHMFKDIGKEEVNIEKLSTNELKEIISKYIENEKFNEYIKDNPPFSDPVGFEFLLKKIDNPVEINFEDVSNERILNVYENLNNSGKYKDLFFEKILDNLNSNPDKDTVIRITENFGGNIELYDKLGKYYFKDNVTALESLIENSNNNNTIKEIVKTGVIDKEILGSINFNELDYKTTNLIFKELNNNDFNFEEVFENVKNYKSFMDSLNDQNLNKLFNSSFDTKEELLEFISSNEFKKLPQRAKSTLSDDIISFESLFGKNPNIDVDLIDTVSKIKSDEIKQNVLDVLEYKVKQSNDSEVIKKFNSTFYKIKDVPDTSVVSNTPDAPDVSDTVDPTDNMSQDTILDNIKELIFSGYGLASIISLAGGALATSGLMYRNKKKKIEKSVYKISKYYKLEEEYVYLISDVYYDFSNLFKKKIRNEREYKQRLYEKFNKFKNYIKSHPNKNKIISDIKDGKFFDPLDEYFYNKKRTPDINLAIFRNIKKPDNFNSFKNEFFVDESIFDLVS